VRQTWLKKKKTGDKVALEMKRHPTENRMAFHVRHALDPKTLALIHRAFRSAETVFVAAVDNRDK